MTKIIEFPKSEKEMKSARLVELMKELIVTIDKYQDLDSTIKGGALGALVGKLYFLEENPAVLDAAGYALGLEIGEIQHDDS